MYELLTTYVSMFFICIVIIFFDIWFNIQLSAIALGQVSGIICHGGHIGWAGWTDRSWPKWLWSDAILTPCNVQPLAITITTWTHNNKPAKDQQSIGGRRWSIWCGDWTFDIVVVAQTRSIPWIEELMLMQSLSRLTAKLNQQSTLNEGGIGQTVKGTKKCTKSCTINDLTFVFCEVTISFVGLIQCSLDNSNKQPDLNMSVYIQTNII